MIQIGSKSVCVTHFGLECLHYRGDGLTYRLVAEFYKSGVCDKQEIGKMPENS